MVVGLGIDIAEISRIKDGNEKFGEKFIRRFLTDAEIAEMLQRGEDIITYQAGRWAAKEAVSKALGCGIGKDCAFSDIVILNDEHGAPRLGLTGAAKKRMESLGGQAWHISISHEKNNACAIAVLEKSDIPNIEAMC